MLQEACLNDRCQTRPSLQQHYLLDPLSPVLLPAEVSHPMHRRGSLFPWPCSKTAYCRPGFLRSQDPPMLTIYIYTSLFIYLFIYLFFSFLNYIVLSLVLLQKKKKKSCPYMRFVALKRPVLRPTNVSGFCPFLNSAAIMHLIWARPPPFFTHMRRADSV